MIQSKLMMDGGINDNLRGPTYQMRLLELFAVTSTFANMDFKLTSELVDAGKFDDVVLNYTSADGNTRVRLLQAKHRNSPKAMNLDFLLTNKEFSLHKYFISLLEIKEKFPDIDIEDLILATNNFISKRNESFLKVGKAEHAIYLEKIETSDICLNGIGDRYKLVSRNHQEDRNATFQVIKNYLIATELFEVMFTAASKDLTAKHFPVLNSHRKFIFEKILDDKFELQSGFIDGSDETLTRFRKLFEISFNSDPKSDYSKKFKNSNAKNIWDFIKGYKCSVNLKMFFKDSPSSNISEAEMDVHINEFLDKFVYLVNADIQPIHEAIIEQLTNQFGQNAQIYYGVFEFKIKQWLTDKKTTEPITGVFVRECFDEMGSLNIKFYTSELFKKHRNIQFKFPIPGWDENLLNDKMLCLETLAGETSLTCIKIYQFLTNLSKTVVYFKSDDPTDYIEKCLSIFKKFFDCCLIEVTTNFDHKLSENDKNVIIVTHDREFVKDLTHCEVKYEKPSICEDLTEESLAENFNKNVRFQGKDVLVKELVDAKFMEIVGKGLKLSDIINLTQVAGSEDENSGSFDSSFYVTRTILQRQNIKLSILDDQKAGKISDILTFSDGEFNNACKTKPNANIHLFKKIENAGGLGVSREASEDKEKLIWLKSFNQISTLRQYIDDATVDMSEESFCNPPHSINIITDSAGMGKSMLFENMKRLVRIEHPNKWVIKLDLNNYTDVFDTYMKKNSLLPEDLECMLSSDILKLNSIAEIEIFKYAWKSSGNLVMLFDGYDEVGRDYKDIVLNLIKAITKNPRNNIFISTRTEWTTLLENEFSVISHQLKSFDEADQINFLIKFWRSKLNINENQLKEIAKISLKSISTTITKKEEKLTGIPLIIKLLAEYLAERLTGKNFHDILSMVQDANYNLQTLYEDFIKKMFNRHLIQKSKIDETNMRARNLIEEEKLRLTEVHCRLAIKMIFNPAQLKMLPKSFKKDLREKDYNDITDSGIVTKVGNKYKPIHYTFLEFFVANILIKDFDDEKVAKFIIKVVSQNKGLQIIRSFANHQMQNLCDDENLELYHEIIADEGAKNYLTLHVAANEGNIETFNFLFHSLTFNNELNPSNIEQILLATDEKGATFFYYYFQFCDDTLQIFEKIKNLYGLDIVRKILIFVNQQDRLRANVVIAATWHGKNYASLLDWILQNFEEDSEFLKEVFMSVDQDNNGISSNALDKYDKISFDQLLNILKKVKSTLGEQFFKKLIFLQNKKQENFLLMKENCTKLQNCEIFDWLKNEIADKDALKELIYSADKRKKSIIHKYAWYCEKSILPSLIKQFLEWILKEFGEESVEEMVLMKNQFGHLLIHYIALIDNENEAPAVLVKILNLLRDDFGFDRQWLKKIVFQIGRKHLFSLLHYYTLQYRKSNLPELIKQLLIWIFNEMGQETVEELILLKSRKGYSFLNIISSNDHGNEAPTVLIKILNLLRDDFGFDRQWLKRFIFQKCNEQFTLLHYYTLQYKKSNLPELIKQLLIWISNAFGQESVEEMILTKNKNGNLFINLIAINDHENEAPSALIKILNFLKMEFGDAILYDSISTNLKKFQTLLHFICYYYKISNMENMLLPLIVWLQKNLSQSQFRNLIFATNDAEKTFIQALLGRSSEDLGMCCDVSCKVTMKLDEIMDEKGYLLKFVQQKYKDSMNLIEFLASQNKDFGEWLKLHPEYTESVVPPFSKESIIQEAYQFRN